MRPEGTITFRPVAHDDLPMLRVWVERPHWREWWGDPERELGYIRDMIEGRDTTRPYIFQIDGKDAGYIQYWSIRDQIAAGWDDDEKWLTMVDPDFIGVDISIAEPGTLSRGVGSRVVSAFCDRLRARGFRRILIDPDIRNKRAIRAYEKAGFRVMAELDGKTGDTFLMRHEAGERC